MSTAFTNNQVKIQIKTGIDSEPRILKIDKLEYDSQNRIMKFYRQHRTDLESLRNFEEGISRILVHLQAPINSAADPLYGEPFIGVDKIQRVLTFGCESVYYVPFTSVFLDKGVMSETGVKGEPIEEMLKMTGVYLIDMKTEYLNRDRNV